MLEQFQKYKIGNHIRINAIFDSHKSHIGCMKSHIQAIYTAYKDKCEYAFIMEDDFFLDMADPFEFISPLLKKLPPDWEILQLHSIIPNLHQTCLAKKEDFSQNMIIKGYFMSCAFYIINRRGMEHFLNNFVIFKNDKEETYDYKIIFEDNALVETMVYRFINCYTTLLPLFNTQESVSDMNYDNVDYNVLTQKLITPQLNYIRSLSFSPLLGCIPYHLHWVNPQDSEYFLQLLFLKSRQLHIFLTGTLAQQISLYFYAHHVAKTFQLSLNILALHTKPFFISSSISREKKDYYIVDSSLQNLKQLFEDKERYLNILCSSYVFDDFIILHHSLDLSKINKFIHTRDFILDFSPPSLENLYFPPNFLSLLVQQYPFFEFLKKQHEVEQKMIICFDSQTTTPNEFYTHFLKTHPNDSFVLLPPKIKGFVYPSCLDQIPSFSLEGKDELLNLLLLTHSKGFVGNGSFLTKLAKKLHPQPHFIVEP